MTRHEKLLEEYARDLRVAKTFVEEWWSRLNAVGSSQPGTRGLPPVQVRWPDGPASHPRVLAVIRHYWLACEALNEEIQREELPEEVPDYGFDTSDESDGQADEADDEEDDEEDDEVYPHVFVLEWLMTDEHDDLAEFLGSLTYWPVGLDENERYV